MGSAYPLSLPAMKHKRSHARPKAIGKDHGRNLYDTLLVMMLLFLVLWYLNI